MALNRQPLPEGWIKEGMVVRCIAPVGLMLVKHVDDSGVDARRARSSKLDAIHLNANVFTPATIEDRILFTLDDARIGEVRKIIPDGKDDRQFRIIFLSDRPATPVIDQIKTMFEKVESPERLGNALVVAVPQSWLNELVVADPVTPAVAARAEAEAALVMKQVADSAVVDWFTRSFTRAGVDMTGVQIAPTHRLGRTMGQDPTYALIWPSTQVFTLQIKGISAAAKELRLRDFFANGTKIIVDLPENWTPTYGEVVAVEDNLITESIVAAMRDVEPDDTDLSETARLIADLRERNQRLQDEVESLGTLADDRLILIDSLTAEIDARDLRAQDAEEAAEMLVSIQPLTVCKEVKTVYQISDAYMEKYLNDGWDILHIQFEDDRLNAVFTRNKPAPAAPTTTHASARLVKPVGPHIIVEPTSNGGILSPQLAMNQGQSPAVNFGTDIATARATLAAMMNDPDVSHEDFYRAVITSRLPKADKDVYIEQSRQWRIGGKIAEQTALLVPSPFANRPPVFIQAHERAEVLS